MHVCCFALRIAFIRIALLSLELYFIALPRTSFAHFYFAFRCPRIRFPWQCAALHCHRIDCNSFTALHLFALNCMETSLSVMRLCSARVVDTSSPHAQGLYWAFRQPSRRPTAAQSHLQDGIAGSQTVQESFQTPQEKLQTAPEGPRRPCRTSPTSQKNKQKKTMDIYDFPILAFSPPMGSGGFNIAP